MNKIKLPELTIIFLLATYFIIAKEKTTRYDDGAIKARFSVSDSGFLDGPCILYYTNGNVKANGFYSHGTRVSTWSFYDSTGQFLYEETMNNEGKIVSRKYAKDDSNNTKSSSLNETLLLPIDKQSKPKKPPELDAKVYDLTKHTVFMDTSDVSSEQKFIKGGLLKGKRPGADIMKTVTNNISFLRDDYHKRLQMTPDLKGKITVKFSIINSGEVNSCEVVISTLPDDKLQRDVVKRLFEWDFDNVEIQNDTTEAVYTFIYTPLKAKVPPIVNCENCKKGIYKSFEEFKTNNPSGKKDFFIETGADYYAMEPSKVKYLNQRGKKRTYNKKGWGLCDSLNIYVYFNGKYCLLTVYPLYSFLLYSSTFFIPPTIFGPRPGVISIPVKFDIDYALDMKTGKIFKLKNLSLKNILKDDPELLLRFKKDDEKRKKRLQYLVEYNKRNASRANE